MKRPTAVATAALALVLGAASPSSAQDGPQIRLEPGLWTFEFKVTENGVRAPDKTDSRCFTEAEVGDLLKTLLGPVEKDKPCTEQQHSVTGRTLSFAAVCKPRDGLEMAVEGTYVFEDTKHFTHAGRIAWTSGTQKTETSFTADARLAGACPK